MVLVNCWPNIIIRHINQPFTASTRRSLCCCRLSVCLSVATNEAEASDVAGVSIPGPPGFVFTSGQLVMMPKARDAKGVAASVCLSVYLFVFWSVCPTRQINVNIISFHVFDYIKIM